MFPKWLYRSVYVAVGAMLLVSSGCTREPTRRVARNDGTVSASDIAKNPAKYFGQTVTVKSEVADVVSPHAFTLDEDAAFAGPDVLVLVNSPGGPVKDDTDVTVTGQVRALVPADIKREFAWFDPAWLTTAHYDADANRRPVIIAQSVKTKDGIELVQKAVSGAVQAGDAPVRPPVPIIRVQPQGNRLDAPIPPEHPAPGAMNANPPAAVHPNPAPLDQVNR